MTPSVRAEVIEGLEDVACDVNDLLVWVRGQGEHGAPKQASP